MLRFASVLNSESGEVGRAAPRMVLERRRTARVAEVRAFVN